MPFWRRKSSPKEVKTNEKKQSFIDTIHEKFKNASKHKESLKSGKSKRVSGSNSERGFVVSRSALPSTQVSRCQSFADRQPSQPLPLPRVHHSQETRCCHPLALSSLSRLASNRAKHLYGEGELATASVSSDSSLSTDDPIDSQLISPQASDYESATRTAINSPSNIKNKDQSPKETEKEQPKLLSLLLSEPVPPTPPKPRQRPKRAAHVQTLQIPTYPGFFSAPTSMKTSPSRSPPVFNSKPCPDVSFCSSGHCVSPGSRQTSRHNSVDTSGQILWPISRCSPESSPILSPKLRSPGPCSKVLSGAVTPVHSAGVATMELPPMRLDEGRQQQRHRLPVPPLSLSVSSPFSPPSTSAPVSPSILRSPGRAESSAVFSQKWKKGRLLGRGTFGEVYLGFNSETGEMCAMKEVTVFPDDAKSRECAEQLGQEILLLSSLRHPNIVQYYGSESVNDKLYIYLEYVSGGSIHKLLQEYGQLGEPVIRSYTQQILSGLVFLHAKNTVHRDIKGANLLVDPSGCVKLADFGMAKHISGQPSPLSFKGSPYWMAPEVIKNSNGYNLSVDIWSLGCTVLEMATAKPPWSQYEGIPALFKIGNSKELPTIPNHLSQQGKDFVMQCLQRDPQHRPTAAELLEHPFVKNSFPLERPSIFSGPSHSPLPSLGVARPVVFENIRNLSYLKPDRVADYRRTPSDIVHMPRINLSCPVSPIGSPLWRPRSSDCMISPPVSSVSNCASGYCTPNENVTLPLHIHRPIHEAIRFQRLQKSNLFQDLNPEIARGIPPTSRVYLHSVSHETSLATSPSTWVGHGQTALADHVSQQLLKDRIIPSLGSNQPLESLLLGQTKSRRISRAIYH